MPKPDLKKLQEDVKKIRERFLTMRRLLEEDSSLKTTTFILYPTSVTFIVFMR
jgi:hypothetical protein